MTFFETCIFTVLIITKAIDSYFIWEAINKLDSKIDELEKHDLP